MDVTRVSYVDYICGWNRYTMKILGIWPEKRKYNQASSYIVLLPISTMLLFINIPQTIDLYYIWGDIDLTVENLSVGNMTVLIAVFKTTIFWFSGGSLSILLSHMEMDRKETNTEEEIRRMMRIATICRKISIGSTLTYYFIIILFVVTHILLIIYIGHVLILRCYFPYDKLSTPYYELTIFGQTMAGYCTGGTYTSVDTFVVTLVFHACGQFRNLRQQLSNLSPKNDYEFKTKLAQIVQKHDSLNRFVNMIERQFSDMLLLQMLGCSVQLCVTCFQTLLALQGNDEMILIQMLFFGFYLIYILFQIYLYCYIGEQLITESMGIADAVYECQWYNLSPNQIKSLMIIMFRARVPMHITAAKFCSFSQKLFGKVNITILHSYIRNKLRKDQFPIRRCKGNPHMDLTRVSYVDYIYGWNRLIMKILGIWPEERKYNRASSYLIILPLSIMLLFIAIPQTINLYFIWGDIDLIAENLSVGNMTVLIAVFKTTIFWFSGRSISVLLSNMEEDRKNTKTKEEARRMMYTAKICRRVSLVFLLTSKVLIVFFIILYFIFIRFVGRTLILRSYFPYDIQPTPNYELTVFAQILAAYCTSETYTAVDTFVITLIFHACGQYENLKQRLRDLPSHGGNQFKAELSQIVKKHDSLNRFTDTIEEQFNDMLLFQILGCTVQLCVTCFLVLLSIGRNNEMVFVQLTFFAIFITFILVQIYLYCYTGEKLLSETIGIIDAAYEYPWYELSPNEAKSLMIIMLRARIPLHITAGKFCPLSHKLFSSILKTSMSYLSVLHAMNIVNTE
ncbi:uncharacterized protein LOC124947661 [Vespa velutina]|uniref:uncharacterized protein LOC124947661 n=1 Tax=Vespa velutina TaxID=202808 RepID=UPI001FB2DC3E|nr:uncharacterized protein LOC124947661 [Vespa velutina]